MIKKFIAFLDLVCVLAASLYYIKICGLPLPDFFAVSPPSFLLAGSFVFIFFGRGFLRSLLVPSLLYYGLTGLFLYSWKGMDLAGQVMHILLAVNAVYFVSAALLQIQIIRLTAGVIFGVALLCGIRFNQIRILDEKPHLASKYLPPPARPPKKIKQKIKNKIEKKKVDFKRAASGGTK